MLDPFILDAIADANVGFLLSYRDKLPDRIINIARNYVDALYQEAASLNDSTMTFWDKKKKKPVANDATA